MMSRSLTQAKERGLGHISEKKMSLTYRGLKYNQQKAAWATYLSRQVLPKLTAMTISTKAPEGAFFN